jgi:hypothetical protein
MGILDDAIRQHLDLKRKHGAQEDEVQILEDEAFGPPSRPGDPDFPERPPTGEEQIVAEAQNGEDPQAEATAAPALEEPPPAPELDFEAEPEEPVAPPEPEEPVAAEAEEAAPPPPPVDSPGFFDQASDSGALHEETVEHPAPLPPEDETPPPEPLAEEPEPPAAEPEPAPPTGESTEFEIGEIELELDEEFEEFRETGDEPEATAPPPPPGPAPAPPPPAPAPDEESFEFDAVEEEAVEEGAVEEGAPVEEDGEEDVLEETPEFLRDTPEDERLWFEQGEPKDFDFDDDDGEDEPSGDKRR